MCRIEGSTLAHSQHDVTIYFYGAQARESDILCSCNVQVWCQYNFGLLLGRSTIIPSRVNAKANEVSPLTCSSTRVLVVVVL